MSALDRALQVHSMPRVNPTVQQMHNYMLQTPYELEVTQNITTGTIAPQHGTTRTYVPWNPAFPPYYVEKDRRGGPETASLFDMMTLYANGTEHNRLTVAEELERGRQHFARKSGAALYTAFTSDLTLMDSDPAVGTRTTNRIDFTWLPNNPTDSDWSEAGRIAKALPPNPELFTPDAYYMNNSGMPFRNVY